MVLRGYWNDIHSIKESVNGLFSNPKNTQMEIYNFRSYKQKEGQSLDEFVTELRKLAKNCEFTDTDKEINSLTNYTKL